MHQYTFIILRYILRYAELIMRNKFQQTILKNKIHASKLMIKQSKVCKIVFDGSDLLTAALRFQYRLPAVTVLHF